MKTSKETILKIIEIAKRSEIAYWAFEKKYYPDGEELDLDILNPAHSETAEYRTMKATEKELGEILSTLDLESLKEIEALMYVGKDYRLDPECPAFKAQDAFKSLYKDFSLRKGEDKDATISQIMGKTSLGKYLRDGLDKLGI